MLAFLFLFVTMQVTLQCRYDFVMSQLKVSMLCDMILYEPIESFDFVCMILYESRRFTMLCIILYEPIECF